MSATIHKTGGALMVWLGILLAACAGEHKAGGTETSEAGAVKDDDSDQDEGKQDDSSDEDEDGDNGQDQDQDGDSDSADAGESTDDADTSDDEDAGEEADAGALDASATSDAAQNEDAAASDMDAAQQDAARPAVDAAATPGDDDPGKVSCPKAQGESESCDLSTQVCCVPQGCQSATEACNGGVKLGCDGPEDCAGGQVCCGGRAGPQCAMECRGPALCHTASDCGATELCLNLGGAFGVCAPKPPMGDGGVRFPGRDGGPRGPGRWPGTFPDAGPRGPRGGR